MLPSNDFTARVTTQRIGDPVYVIGGFDQFDFLMDCTPDATPAKLRRCPYSQE